MLQAQTSITIPSKTEAGDLRSGQVKAVYVNERSMVTVSLEQVDILLQDHIPINFPWMVEFEDKIVLGYGRGQHYGPEGETRPIVASTDQGRSWSPLPPDSPFEPASAEAIKSGRINDPVESSGLFGFMRDGTTLYVDTFADGFVWEYGKNPHEQRDRLYSMIITDPKFRVRRFSKKGDLEEIFEMHLIDLPWESSQNYELYGEMLELENGNILAAFQVHRSSRDQYPLGMISAYSVVLARSTDGGKTMKYIHHFDPVINGEAVGSQGCCEPDLVRLPDGDILCVMRSGSDTPMYQARSKDDGRTWSTPSSVGWPGVKPKLRVLGNGVLICSTGRGVYGNPQVTCVMVSLDGTGERWEPPFNFHTGLSCSYTWNLERRGKLEVIYSHTSHSGQPKGTIRRAVFDLQKKKRI